ncbi:MFS transporter [Agaribacterium sp. ZY112]|uniref:MFS transporter n=1 Tax=Agaribacterium sp. ZY112 TaxID=3233574 RepID=UPI0035250D78
MTTAGLRPTRYRFAILSMVFVSVIINYMDRMTMSVVMPILKDGETGIGLSDIEAGYILGVLGIAYTLAQVPGGFLIDLVKMRILYPILIVLWSIASIGQGLVNSVAALAGCRIAIGIFEAPSFPCNNKIVSTWFPEKERASAIAVYTSGQYLGLALLMPFLAIMLELMGWRGLFVVTGTIGIAWGIFMYLAYREPSEHKKVNEAELQHIQQDETIVSNMDQKSNSSFTKRNFAAVFSKPRLWGLFIGQFGLGGALAFYFSWFPTYLKDARGLSFLESGLYGALPFISAFFGVLISGLVSDKLAKRGYSKEFSRKAPVILGLALISSIIAANFTDNNNVIIAVLSVASFGVGLASIAWVFVSLIAPKKLLGLVGGCFNLAGGLGGAAVPICIGYILDANNQDFTYVFVLVAAFALLSMLSYWFLMGSLSKLDGDEA